MVIKINRLQKYLFNGLILSIAAIIMRGVAVSFNVFVTSRVGAEGMGLLNLTQSVYGFAITLATSGINLAVVRLVSGALPYGNEGYFDKKSDRRVRKIMVSALFYCLFFSLLSSVLLYCGAEVIGTHALGDHGVHGAAGGLQHPLEQNFEVNAHGENTADAGVLNAISQNFWVFGLHGVVGCGAKSAKEHDGGREYQRQENTVAGYQVGFFPIALP